MGLVPEDRASARSDEPEARSAARWRGRAVGDTPEGIVERWPALGSCPLAAGGSSCSRISAARRGLSRRTRGRWSTTSATASAPTSRWCARGGRRSRAISVIFVSGRAVTART